MKAKRKSMLVALLTVVVLGVSGKPLLVYAAEATISFGSNWYAFGLRRGSLRWWVSRGWFVRSIGG